MFLIPGFFSVSCSQAEFKVQGSRGQHAQGPHCHGNDETATPPTSVDTHHSPPKVSQSRRFLPSSVQTPPPLSLSLSLSLSSLLLKVCETLKSRSQDARDAARDTLVKMAVALGPAFLPYIFKEMKELLTRGYQVLPTLGSIQYYRGVMLAKASEDNYLLLCMILSFFYLTVACLGI